LNNFGNNHNVGFLLGERNSIQLVSKQLHKQSQYWLSSWRKQPNLIGLRTTSKTITTLAFALMKATQSHWFLNNFKNNQDIGFFLGESNPITLVFEQLQKQS
jgi:hypothetical protein